MADAGGTKILRFDYQLNQYPQKQASLLFSGHHITMCRYIDRKNRPKALLDSFLE